MLDLHFNVTTNVIQKLLQQKSLTVVRILHIFNDMSITTKKIKLKKKMTYQIFEEEIRKNKC